MTIPRNVIPRNATPREAAEAAIDYLRFTKRVPFAGSTQGALSILFLSALAGEWPDHIAFIGQPYLAPEHLVDHLVRTYRLIPEEVIDLGDLLGICSVVDKLPTCGGCTEAARYDAWATRARPAMFLCDTCVMPDAGPALGLGRATYVLTWDEVHWTIRDICDDVTDELGRPSIWPV